MRDLTLKFKDKAEMTAAFTLVGLYDEGFMGQVAVDEIGIYYKNTGTEEEPFYQREPGYLANVRVMDETDVSALDPYIVIVQTPIRVWA